MMSQNLEGGPTVYQKLRVLATLSYHASADALVPSKLDCTKVSTSIKVGIDKKL